MGSGNDAPVDLYIAAYADENAAQADWDDIQELDKDGTIKVEGLVLVSRDMDGKIKVKDNAHTTGHAAAWGAGAGLLVGLIFPPALLASGAVGAGIGAGTGALISHAEKSEIKDEIADDLPYGSSGIVALFDEEWQAEVEKALSNAEKVSKHDVDKGSVDQAKAAAAKA